MILPSIQLRHLQVHLQTSFTHFAFKWLGESWFAKLPKTGILENQLQHNNIVDVYQLDDKAMSHVKNIHQHPPLCPKSPKASTISSYSQKRLKGRDLNKNQRLTAPLPSLPSDHHLVPNPHPPLPKTQHELPSHQQELREEIYNREYQQYSRRNYLRREKVEGRQPKVGSDLTDQMRIKRNLSNEEDRRCKSRSALDYAKYFIKQVSNVPTEPSSKDPQKVNPSQEMVVPEREVHQAEQSPSRVATTRQESKSKNRTNILQKLKSLKNIRSKSRNSASRDLVPSLEKRSSSKPKKLTANLTTLANQTLMAKMKARSRNRRIVLKVRQLNQSSPLEQSMNLMLSSLMNRSHSDRVEVSQKIELQFQLLNLLPEYVKQFKQLYEDVECWQELLFLTYKKFYLERKKLEQALGLVNCRSPFRLPFALVTTTQLHDFTHSVEGIRLEERIRTENYKIECALRELYNHIIEKSGKFINLLQLDNFSLEIYWLMSEQVRLLLAEEDEDDSKSIRWTRVALTLKCFYLISFLNGEQVDIESILMGGQLDREQIDHFWLFFKQLSQ